MADANGYDAIVIGGGHNGLVTAAYLGQGRAADGRARTTRLTLGGAAGTSELAPGVRVPTLAHTVGRLRPSVVRDLDLRRHGLSPRRAGRARLRAGPGRSARSSCGATSPGPPKASASTDRPPTPSATPAFDRLVRSLAGFLGEIAGQTPPDIEAPGLTDALAGLRLGRTFRGLGRQTARTITPRPADGDRRLRRRIVRDRRAPGRHRLARHPVHRDGAVVGRHDRRPAADSAGNDGGAAGQTVFARGGPGALVAALEAAAREAGGEIRTGAEVAAITLA